MKIWLDPDLRVGLGDSISTTGPTGIFVYCRKCTFSRLVGHCGESGAVYYRKLKHSSHDSVRGRRALHTAIQQVSG